MPNTRSLNTKSTSNKQPTYIYALGGLEEIGKNTYVIEDDDGLIIIDAGIKFANEDLLGYDGMIANFAELKKKEGKIKGLIITHGHEDHIGAIPHYLRNLKIPVIYAPVLASKLIEKRLTEYKDIQPPKIVTFTDHDEFKVGSFKVGVFRVCHSIPDAFGLVIESRNGKIVSTGDFRFDFATDGDETDLYQLTKLCAGSVDVLLCESTSAEIPGFSESEKYIIRNVKEYIHAAPGRVLVSTFASNLSRLEEIIAFGINEGRKVLVLGKSMDANIKISRKIGYLKVRDQDFIQASDLPNLPDNEVMVVLTGSQGEEMAAMNIIASGTHSKITLKPSDTVILSSNPIPGNYAAVERMVNNLYKKGATVYENRPEKRIHASGHATRSEQQLMFKAVGAKYIFPIHGEYKMLRSLKKNAIDVGYAPENVMIAQNGQKLKLLNHELTLTDEFADTGALYLNGSKINPENGGLLEERRILSSEGVVQISLCYNLKEKTFGLPIISSRGCFFTKESGVLIKRMISCLKKGIATFCQERNWNFNTSDLEQTIKEIAQKIIWKEKFKRPLIIVNLFDEQKLKRIMPQNRAKKEVKNA